MNPRGGAAVFTARQPRMSASEVFVGSPAAPSVQQKSNNIQKKGTKKHEPKQPQSGWTRCTSGQFCRSDSGGKRSVAGAGKKHFDASGPAAFGKMGAASHERE